MINGVEKTDQIPEGLKCNERQFDHDTTNSPSRLFLSIFYLQYVSSRQNFEGIKRHSMKNNPPF